MRNAPDDGAQPQERVPVREMNEAIKSLRARWLYGFVLCLLYLVAVIPRLREANFSEPDLTYADEFHSTIGQAERILSTPGGRIENFWKPPGIAHFLILLFKPYFWLVKDYFGWETIDDVQWWRVRHFWRAVNILLGGLTIILAGIVGARAFNWRVGLLAAAFCATSRMSTIWCTYLKEEGLMTLACPIVIYAAFRFLRPGPRRLWWVLLSGAATGSAVAFKYNAAPVVFFFLAVLYLSPSVLPPSDHKALKWLGRLRIAEVFAYGASSVVVFLAWFPQLVFRTRDVWQHFRTLDQFRCMDVTQVTMPSVGEMLSVTWATWSGLFYQNTMAEVYPLYFLILMTAVLVIAPFCALVRRDRFVLALSVFIWLTYLMIYYQWLFSGWRMNHYFLPAIVAMLLVLTDGLDRISERIGIWASKIAPVPSRTLRNSLLVLLCIWPLIHTYSTSLQFLATLHSSHGARNREEARAVRRKIISGLPAGARVFYPDTYTSRARISDSLFDLVVFRNWHIDKWGTFTLDDLARQGFDYGCFWAYPQRKVELHPYFVELVQKQVKPTFDLPGISRFYTRYSYVPLQPGDGESFNLGLYFREPNAGDYAGVRGILLGPLREQDTATTQNFILNARLYNGHKWFEGFFRWEVLVDGRTLWHGRDTTESFQVSLSLPFAARAGAEILIRTMRTGHRQESTWGWGSFPSHLKVDGLRLIFADSGRSVPIRWTYTGRNGGPGPARYAMRKDWFHNENPVPLLDGDFDGTQPLVEAWRPYRLVEPENSESRKTASVEQTAGMGLGGSNALRFAVQSPVARSLKMGIMQPMAYPAAQRLRTIRVHYRTDSVAGNRGPVELCMMVTGLSLSGEYIDRAQAIAPSRIPSQWDVLELNVATAWKRKHTRVDLIDFLEVAIEARAGPGAVFNYLIDKVEWECE